MDDGLKMVLESMQKDLGEVKADVRSLLETRWKSEGKATVITVTVGAVITMVFQIVLAIIQSKGG